MKKLPCKYLYKRFHYSSCMSVEIKEINTEPPPGYPWHHGVHLLAYHCDTGTGYTAPVMGETLMLTSEL